jgi:16S rRNA C967 or C1407 C5-methylase (RsmB/RsmF family)
MPRKDGKRDGKRDGGGGGVGGATKIRPLDVVAAEYEAHFQHQYGGRWPALRAALLRPLEHACLVNKYSASSGEIEAVAGAQRLPFKLPCYRRQQGDAPFAQPPADGIGLLSYYLIDAAAVLAVEALELEPADVVLDVCAAPGAKAIAILQQLDLSCGQLQCNDASADRAARLRRVVGQYVPRELSLAIKVTTHDATVQSSFPRLYSKVLVDAPCSSDRHALQNLAELQRWHLGLPARNAERQFKLLCTALQAARSPALVVYSTAALDERENDGVVRAVLRRFPERVRVRPAAGLALGERTDLGGWLILPDTADGLGPCYFCTLEVYERGATGVVDHEAEGDGTDDSDDSSDAGEAEVAKR